MFRLEYGYYPHFRSTKELSNILEGENEKGIRFHSYSDYERNEAGYIIDPFENEVIISISGAYLVCISAGENGEFDSVDHVDDIILHHKLKHNNAGDDNSE